MAGDGNPEDSPAPGNGPAQGMDDTMTTDEYRTVAGGAGGLTIGTELRLRREERNQTIRDVADVVRIQIRYLEALEEDRIENLPGRVYALGFVRTYSEYLGLDANDMVERFKQEAAGLEPQSDLTMPEPVDEGKVPTVAIIIVAVLLAGAAYSAWYFMSGTDSRVADIVPEVPEHLAGLAEENALVEAPAEFTPNDDATAPTAGSTEAPDEAADAATATEPPPEPEAPQPVAVEPPETPPAPETQAATAPAQATESPAPTPAPAPEPSPPAPEPEAVAVAPPSPPPAPQPAVARDPVVYGGGNQDARVVITAVEDAWIEVTDGDSAILFSRVLRKGDRYRVPNDRPGATFVTGNAGGLAIEVDGNPVPALGPAGVVRKNVRLDPDLLKAGQAIP